MTDTPIEVTVYKYLKDWLSINGQDTKVYTEYPSNPPASFFVVDLIGTSGSVFVYDTTVAIQAWSASKLGAATMMEQIKRAMVDIISQDRIIRCDLQSMYPFPDMDSKQYRYQAVFELKHY